MKGARPSTEIPRAGVNNLNRSNTMNNEINLGLDLNEEELAAFESGETTSKFLLEEGVYDAVVRGYVIKPHVFEGDDHGPKIQLIWQLADSEGLVHSLLGKRWKICADERSVFRKEVSKWFNKTDWPTIVDILKKGGILVTDENGAHFDVSKFIGKKGKLMVNQVTSKKGKTFNDIVSISPASKTAKDVANDDIPEWMLTEALDYKLADGIGVRAKEESAEPAEQAKAEIPGSKAPRALPKGAIAKGVDPMADDDLPF